MNAAIGHGEKLSRKQDALILALLVSPTIKQAAQKTGLSESTARRWLKDPSFKAAYREARQLVYDQAIVALQALATAAIATLARNLKADAPPAVQVAAARTVLEYARTAVTDEQLMERIEALEAEASLPARRSA